MNDEPGSPSLHDAPRRSNYIGWAILTWVLYYVFWLPGFVTNIIVWRSARRSQRVTGLRPVGKGCLFWLFVWGIGSLLLGLAVVPLRATVQPFRLVGHTMELTIHDGDLVLASKAPYKVDAAHRGDIIVFKFPGDTMRDFVERVIGLPGETIMVQNGTVSINNAPLRERYIPASDRPDYKFGPYTVPPNTVFTLGDNRNNSYDGHSWATAYPLTGNLILGKIVVIYWPASHFTTDL